MERLLLCTPRLLRVSEYLQGTSIYASIKPALHDQVAPLYNYRYACIRYACIINSDHRHPSGPWVAILDAVKALNLATGAVVLDVASGPGEPALTIAKALPHVTVSY